MSLPMDCVRVWPLEAAPLAMTTACPPEAYITPRQRGEAGPELGRVTQWIAAFKLDRKTHRPIGQIPFWIIQNDVIYDDDEQFTFGFGHWQVEWRHRGISDLITQPGLLYRPTNDQAYDVPDGHEQWWLLVNPDQEQAWEPLTEYFLQTGKARLCCDTKTVAVYGNKVTGFIFDVPIRERSTVDNR